MEEHFFRHEYGRLVATLVRRFGARHLEAVEDAVQSALMRALEAWPASAMPDNPSAWLFRVSHNALLGDLRQRDRRRRILEGEHDPLQRHDPASLPSFGGELHDDLLLMLFVCCDDGIPADAQLVLALKTLCGFDVREIAIRLFVSEATVYKRLERARHRLRQTPLVLDAPTADQFAARLPAVHQILYLLFTEGHLSSDADTSIRQELSDEAIRLTSLVAEHGPGRSPETCALLALMHLHAARITARTDAAGGLLLLAEQDRSAWDQDKIAVGLAWLEESARGDVYSRYHAEAAIAAEHCLATSMATTRWDRVVECYALLEQTAPSALHRLNRAVAMAEWQGPAAGLALVEGFHPPSWLAGSYQWAAVLADLHMRCGNQELGRRYRDVALKSAPSQAVRELLQRRLHVVGSPAS